jgi:hypothetical protein
LRRRQSRGQEHILRKRGAALVCLRHLADALVTDAHGGRRLLRTTKNAFIDTDQNLCGQREKYHVASLAHLFLCVLRDQLGPRHRVRTFGYFTHQPRLACPGGLLEFLPTRHQRCPLFSLSPRLQ